MSLRYRFGAPDRIRYVLLGGAREEPTFHIPRILSNGTLDRLQKMPKAIRQYVDPVGWHRLSYNVGAFRHYDFGVVYDDAPASFLSHFFDPRNLTVIFLYSQRPDFHELLKEHAGQCLIWADEPAIRTQIEADGQLREALCRDFSDFFSKLAARVATLSKRNPDSVERSITASVDQLREYLTENDTASESDFRACISNTNTFLQLLAPFGRELLTHCETLHPDRPAALIASATRVLDGYSLVTLAEDATEHSWPKFLPPLILIWPYYGPAYKELFKQFSRQLPADARSEFAVIGKLALTEQDRDTYDFHSDSSLFSEPSIAMAAIHEFHMKMTQYLDNLGFLHASFQDSPVIRMPTTGKSINETLSLFHPSVARSLGASTRANKRLTRCGEALGNRFPQGFLAHIDRYYDQIVAISDIPIEWTICDRVPLAFLTDVCRLPQSLPSSLMAQFTSNSLLGYSVPKDILKNTLIVCGADSDEPIGKAFDSLISELLRKDDLGGVRAIRCRSKADFVSAIEQIRPDLLIVDSHGDFRSNEEGSYLKIGQDKILGPDIVAIRHATPLVILSCCLTAPVYGCQNTIAQAFFEAGARSVLSTFLPISFDRAYMLYRRILANLKTAASASFHRNWLSFISHNIRTSHFDDYLFLLRKRLAQDVDRHLFQRNRMQWSVDSMAPAKRRACYLETKARAIACFPSELQPRAAAVLEREEILPEAFFYTLLGRADLVQFDSWLKKEVSTRSEAMAMYEEIIKDSCL